MALHDFWCQVCGEVLLDVNVPIEVGAQAGAPVHCDRPASWIPQVGRMDAYEPGQEFETYDGQNRPVLIDSLRKLRSVEDESRRMAENGEGQPLIWRSYSNNRSNRDVHTLAPSSWQGGAQPDPAWVKAHAGDLKKGEALASTDYGPGVSDASPCALDTLERRDG